MVAVEVAVGVGLGVQVYGFGAGVVVGVGVAVGVGGCLMAMIVRLEHAHSCRRLNEQWRSSILTAQG